MAEETKKFEQSKPFEKEERYSSLEDLEIDDAKFRPIEFKEQTLDQLLLIRKKKLSSIV